MTISVSGLTVYPIKSARGIVHTTAHLDDFGFWMDRRWMLVQPDGRFLSQRTLPTMALLETTLEAEGTLTVRHIARPSSSALTLAVPNAEAATCEVEVWGDRCVALLAEASAHTWFTQTLGVDCRAVYMPTTTHRPVANDAQTRVSFSDGYPLLVLSEASLEDLNQRLAAPLPMNRFRPNIVVRGCEPYAEDQWQQIQIGPVVLDLVKPCSRCTITTTDQDTAQRSVEPLRTLATYRRVDGKVMLGQNAIHRNTGTLQVGDAVTVLSSKP